MLSKRHPELVLEGLVHQGLGRFQVQIHLHQIGLDGEGVPHFPDGGNLLVLQKQRLDVIRQAVLLDVLSHHLRPCDVEHRCQLLRRQVTQTRLTNDAQEVHDGVEHRCFLWTKA